MFAKIKLGLAFILLVWFGSLNAEEPSKFTLEDCIQHALNHNPSAAYAMQTEQAATEDVIVAKDVYYPEIGLQTGYRRWYTHAFLPEGLSGPRLPPVIGPINDYQLNVRTNYLIYDGGQRSSTLSSARAQLSVANEESKTTSADIIYRTQTAFYEVLQAEDAVELAKQREGRSKDHLKIAEDRKAAGAVPLFDVTRSRTEVASAELGIASAESQLRIALGHLNQEMGRSASAPLQIARPVLVPPDPAQVSIEADMQKAIENRPEVLAAQQRVELKRSQIKAVHSDVLPKVKAEAGFGWRDDDFNPPDKDWWVGVMLNVPLFDAGVRSHRTAKSKIEANREAEQLSQVKLSVQQEVWTTYSQWMEAYQALQTSGVMKDEAAESLGLMKARYEEGAGTINDLLDAELSLNESEMQLNNARYRVHIAYTAFLRSAGQL